MARSAATEAENRPVYGAPVYAQDNMNGDTRTHKDEDAISILLPGFDHLIVFLLRNLGVHGEERLRAVTKVGFSWRWLIRCRLRMFVVDICCNRHYEAARGHVKTRVTYLGHFPSRGLLEWDEAWKGTVTRRVQGRPGEFDVENARKNAWLR